MARQTPLWDTSAGYGNFTVGSGNYSSSSAALGYVGMATSIVSTLNSAYAAYAQGKIRKGWNETNKYIADLNSQIAEMEAANAKLLTDFQTSYSDWQAKQATQRGQIAESRARGQTKKTIGAQRAALAAQGIKIDEGSARDIQLETADIGEFDAMNIRNNAAMEAFGYKSQGITFQMQGDSRYFSKLIEASKYKMRSIDYSYRGKMAEMEGTFGAAETVLGGAIKTFDYYRGTQTTKKERPLWED